MILDAPNRQLDGVWRNQTPTTGAASKPGPSQSVAPSPELLTEREAAALLGVGVRKFHELRAAEWMPKAIELGPRALRWSRAELLAALAERAPRRVVLAEPKHLRQVREVAA